MENDDIEDDDYEDEPRALKFEEVRDRLVEAAKKAGLKVLHVAVTLDLNTLDRRLTLKLVPAAWEGNRDYPHAEVGISYGSIDSTMAEDPTFIAENERNGDTEVTISYFLIDHIKKAVPYRRLDASIGGKLDALRAAFEEEKLRLEVELLQEGDEPKVMEAKVVEIGMVSVMENKFDTDIDFFPKVLRGLRAIE